MKALIFDRFGTTPDVRTVPDPEPDPHGIVVKVEATGLCRSDWHGWMGHDPDIELPHVPGHEFAGTVVALGREVTRFKPGDRITVPFVGGCGQCQPCHAGDQQVCDNQFQPGFTHWGSFAEYVAVQRADLNVVHLPDSMRFDTAASLGCRFATAFRAVIDQGRAKAGEWVAVHGCGGVGLSAVMIAQAAGANVIAVDINAGALDLAQSMGAVHTLNAREVADIPGAIIELTQGGVHLSLDALGHSETCANSIENLRTRGRHVQVGLMAGEHSQPTIPMGRVIAKELELLGSHGLQAHRYDAMFAMVQSGRVDPARILGREISLSEASEALMAMDRHEGTGATVITRF
ncbi:MAG: zinc-dependent alcohol dehydrogenase family protein [Pseudomonadota bacterium]